MTCIGIDLKREVVPAFVFNIEEADVVVVGVVVTAGGLERALSLRRANERSEVRSAATS
jgi:hypothetical protein